MTPVKPARRESKARLERSGPRRVIDGIAWANYCSRTCTALAVGAAHAGSPAAAAALKATNERSYRARCRARLEAAAAPLVAAFHIPAAPIMKALWACEVRGYRRGFAAACAQRRRKRIA